jgi:hypothetical protein
MGSDGIFRAYVFRSGEAIPYGPYATEGEAMKALSDELKPKEAAL